MLTVLVFVLIALCGVLGGRAAGFWNEGEGFAAKVCCAASAACFLGAALLAVLIITGTVK